MDRHAEIETPVAYHRAPIAARRASASRGLPSRPSARHIERPLPRPEPDRDPVLAFGEFRLDEAEQRLLRGSAPVPLNPKSFAVLAYLSRHAGRLVTKDDLFAAVWSDTVVSDATLTSCIKEVRKALGDDARRPTFVETAHRRGYRFVAAVASVPRAVPCAAPTSWSDLAGDGGGPVVVRADPEVFDLLARLGVDLEGRREVVLVRVDA